MLQVQDHINLSEKILPFSNILLENFQVTYFHFVRIYHDGTRISLTNCKQWMKFYYENKFFQTPTFFKSHQSVEDKHCLWVTHQDDKILSILKDKYNIGNGVTYIEKYTGYCEYCYFGTYADNYSIYNLYMNKKTLFKDFVTFFKAHAKDIIKKCEINRIPKLIEKPVFPIENSYPVSTKEFFDLINKSNYSLHITEDIRISRRELQCIIWCMKGKTADEIGQILGISKRAVEAYTQNLKEKFKCYKTTELVYKISQCGISLDHYLDESSSNKK